MTGAPRAKKTKLENRESGIVLLAVLWITTLLALLVAGFSSAVLSDAREVANRGSLARAQALAEAGLARAALGLLDPEEETRWRADGRLHRFAFDAVPLDISILGENGRIDLNKAGEPLLQGLLTQSGLDRDAQEALLDALLDWRDRDDARRAQGAEDRDYQQAGEAHGAGDGPFAHVSQLRDLLGMTEGTYRALLPLVTVNARSGRIDPANAATEVLQVLPGIDASDIEALLSLRTEVPLDLPALRATLASAEGLLDFNSGPAFAVTVMGRLENGLQFEREAVIWLQPDAEAAYRILEWREPRIPRSVRESWGAAQAPDSEEEKQALETDPAGGPKES